LSDTWELGVWKVSEDRLLFIFETPKGLYADEGSGAFGPGGKSFVFTAGIEACRFDLCTGLLTAKWKLNPGWSREIQYDHEGRLILFSCEQRNEGKTGLWKLYELNDGSPPKALTLQRDQSWSAEGGALSPDGRIAIVWSEPRSGRPRTMRALAVENGSELWHAQTESLGGNVRVGFDPQGEHFSYSSMSTNMAWVLLRTADFHEIGRVSDIYQCIGPEAKLFAGNGLLLPDQSGWMHAIPLTLSRGKHLKYVYAFSGDGKRLACGTSEGVVLVVETEELTRRIAELSDPNMSAPPKGTCPD
jgi:hypothetical protein